MSLARVPVLYSIHREGGDVYVGTPPRPGDVHSFLTEKFIIRSGSSKMSSRQHPLAPKRSSTAAAGAASSSKHAKPMDSVETLVGSEKVSMESFELMRMLGKGGKG